MATIYVKSKVYTVYNDIHEFAPHALNIPVDPQGVYAGDIVDLYSCKPEELPTAYSRITELKNLLGDRYIYGNHELNPAEAYDNYVDEGIYFCHGHMQMMVDPMGFMKSKPGASDFKRFWIKMGEYLRKFLNVPITDDQAKKFLAVAKIAKCHTVVCGHHHPKKPSIKDFDYNGEKVRIIILPRGKHQVVNDNGVVKILKTSDELYLNK